MLRLEEKLDELLSKGTRPTCDEDRLVIYGHAVRAPQCPSGLKDVFDRLPGEPAPEEHIRFAEGYNDSVGMFGPRSLALVAHGATLDRVPDESRILPLEPTVSVNSERRIANRPEDFLRPEDDVLVEKSTEQWASDWWRGTDPDTFEWNGVNLAECFSFAVTFVVRDLLKTSIILERLFERERPERILCDVPPPEGGFRPYPHLDAIGLLAASRSAARGLRFEPLSLERDRAKAPSRSALAHAYLSVATRRALSVLRGGRPLVAVGPHREFYEPVAAAWHGGSASTVVVTPSRLPIRSSPRAHLFVAALDAIGGGTARPDVLRFLARATATIGRITPPASLDEAASDLWEPLRAEIGRRIRADLTDLAAAGVAFEDGLDRAAHLLLVETTSPLAKAMVRFARRKTIPVTVIQHGILAGEFSYRQTEADRVAAWGPGDADWFRKNLGPSVDVEPTGSPRYDGLRPGRAARLPAAVARLRPGTPLVLFASQPFVQDRAGRSPWVRRKALEIVLDSVRAKVGLTLAVKWHPAEHPELLPAFNAPSGGRVVSIQHADTLALIERSHVVLAVSSTVALEAMYLRRPVVFVGPADPDSPFHPPEQGGGCRAKTAADLSSILDKLLEHPEHRKRVLDGQAAFLTRFYAPLDGRAAERVVDLLRAR